MNDEDQIRNIIKEEQTRSQYQVPTTSFHVHNNIDSPFIPFLNVSDAPHNFCIAIKTTGTTPTPIFGTNGFTFNGTVTGMFLTSLDTTAGNITLVNNSITIATVAKGTTAGVMVGATNLSTGTLATFSVGNSLNVVSSSVGDAMVFLTFTV